ncbi:hypothetical protein DB30_06683 [Enhygromyxa salina]|uniref:Uncharacterized protein n=1 Tax=Enhygromyxa salina TaxID=215803 RepID=A0A0C2CY01_9BACT|nr:hypothetical protein DB30_06683 [Enhygromyxa salina]
MAPTPRSAPPKPLGPRCPEAAHAARPTSAAGLAPPAAHAAVPTPTATGCSA